MSTLTEFYDPELYDLETGDTDPSTRTVEFYRHKAGKPTRVLDIGAGTGRLAIPLLLDGHTVVCVERSKAMLQALQTKAQRLDHGYASRLTVACQPFDRRQQELSMSIAFAMDDFLLHLTTADELRLFFRNLGSWLRRGGRFVTDIRHRRATDLLRKADRPTTVQTFGIRPGRGAFAEEQRHCTMFWEEYDVSTQILVTTCQYQELSPEGVVKSTFYRVLRQRIHSNAEVVQSATESGFRLLDLSERNRPGLQPESDIGGTFEFRLLKWSKSTS